MHISIQSNLHGGVTKEFTEHFDIHPGLYAPGSESMPQRVKFKIPQSMSLAKFFEP